MDGTERKMNKSMYFMYIFVGRNLNVIEDVKGCKFGEKSDALAYEIKHAWHIKKINDEIYKHMFLQLAAAYIIFLERRGEER